jgi:hypothetical protein
MEQQLRIMHALIVRLVPCEDARNPRVDEIRRSGRISAL